jgi:large subunit ribosomal protein L9
MKVVFLEEVEGTARTGDVKNVADGFARNYLLPRRLAAPATDHYITIAQAKAGKEARRQEKVDDEARERVLPKVDGKSVEIEVRVGEQGKLFGSVTARDIAEALQAATRVELEHRQVDLKEPIRELGAHDVTIKVTRNVLATVTVTVAPLGGSATAEEGEAESADGEAAAAEEAESEGLATLPEVAEEETADQQPAIEAGETNDEPAEEEDENDSLEQ